MTRIQETFHPNLDSRSEETITRDSMNMDDAVTSRSSSVRGRIVQTIIDLVIIIIIFAIFGIVYLAQAPKIRYFTCNDSDIFFPFKTDTIPFWAVGIFGALGPLVFILAIELINARVLPFQHREGLSNKERWRKYFICVFHAISLFVLGISLVLCLTEIGKRWVGRLRPHFIDVCKPDWSKVKCTSLAETGTYYNSIFTGDAFCTANAKDVQEARFSFPSGHSSFSWYTMAFLIIFIEARLQLLKLRYIKPLIQLAAFSAAFVTSLSRVSDYHHRLSDVFAGSGLGIIIALYITFVAGRVLWDYECEKKFTDFDLKARNYHTKPTTREF